MKLKFRIPVWITVALIAILLVGASGKNPFDEIVSLIKKVTTAKVKYEEANYFNLGVKHSRKNRYAGLVKTFKQKDKIELYRECLRKMIIRDSIAHIDTFVTFTYLPLISSTVTKCNEMRNLSFLKTMLMNLNDPDNDSTLVCDLKILK